MQPRVAAGLNAERHKRIVSMLAVAASEAAPRGRAHEVAVQPFHGTAGKRQGLSLIAREPAIELGDPRSLVEEHLPVFGRPAVPAGL